MRVTKAFTKDCIKDNQMLIIYGAGRYGEIAYRGLELLGITPDYFADRALAGTKYMGIPVIAPNMIIEHESCVVLIAVLNHFYEVLEFLQNQNIENYYDISTLLMLDVDEKLLSEYALDEKHNPQKYLNTVENYSEQQLIINHVDTVVTECCTLKCKDCANLMQYYVKPQNLDINEIIKYFNKFLDSIDVLLELRILGGEPFIHKDLDQLIHTYANNDKVRRIVIYTNSTLIPEQKIISSLKHSKVSVHMSDYGKNSYKVNELADILDKNNVLYTIHKYENWFDLGDISKRDFSVEAMEKIYSNCLDAECHTFYRGKFYICPRSAHGERIGVFINNLNEYVDYTDENLSLNILRNKLVDLITNTRMLTACNYCNGLNNQQKTIPAALQKERV